MTVEVSNDTITIMRIVLGLDRKAKKEILDEPLIAMYRAMLLTNVEVSPIFGLDIDLHLKNGEEASSFGFACVFRLPEEVVSVTRVRSILGENTPYRVADNKIYANADEIKVTARVVKDTLSHNLRMKIIHEAALAMCTYYSVPRSRYDMINKDYMKFRSQAASVALHKIEKDSPLRQGVIDELEYWPGSGRYEIDD